MANSWRNYSSRYNIVCLLIGDLSYFINQELKHITDNVIVHSYFNDFLAMLVLLPFSNLLLQMKNKGVYSAKGICFFTLLASIEWEYIAPMYVKNSVSDPKDIIAYFLGAIIYYSLFKTKGERKIDK